MRVIGGEFRSRRIYSKHGRDIRPTPDRLRETLFDILASRIENSVFADLYAGTGAVGIEALSRGARKVIFVERSRSAVDLIRRNLDSLGARDRTEIYCAKASTLAERIEADIVFLDPPYDREDEFHATLEILGGRALPLVIVQHSPRTRLREIYGGETYGGLFSRRVVRQGDNSLSFFTPEG